MPAYVHHVWRACGGQKMAVDPLELELKTVVNHQVDAGIWIHVLYKNSLCSSEPRHLSGLKFAKFHLVGTDCIAPI